MGSFGKTRLATIGVAALVGAWVVAKLIKTKADPSQKDSIAYKVADTLGF